MWERRATTYDGEMMRTYRDAYARSVDRALAVAQPTSRVLEMGCGTGIIAMGVAPHVAQVIGTDLSPQMIAVAQDKARSQGAANVEFRVADGYSQPFDDASFDVVLLFNLLHVVEQPEALLREARRLLKPAGYLVTATDCYAETPSLKAWSMMVGLRLLKLVGALRVVQFYKQRDLHRLFEQAGLTVAETDVLHPAPVNYYVLARKG